jgi:hypothetical protein
MKLSIPLPTEPVRRKDTRSRSKFNTLAVRPRESVQITSRTVPACPEWMTKPLKPPSVQR